MGSRVLVIFFAFSIFVYSTESIEPSAVESLEPPRRVYIVFTDGKTYNTEIQYLMLLKKVLHGSSPAAALVHSYGRTTYGFAATLTDEEAEKLKGFKGVWGVVLDKPVQPFDGFPADAPYTFDFDIFF